MPDMIYLVSQGEYSDYEIVHVFSDEETATRHVERWNVLWPLAGSMERRVDPRKVESDLPELAVLHHAEWWSHEDDGDRDVHEVGVIVEMDEHTGQLDHLVARHFGNGTATFRCSSFDPERAIKIVSDARAKFLAEEQTERSSL